ncbi:MAG: hypothetical protein ACI4QT_05070 [Kiritimatiellia bacterium]
MMDFVQRRFIINLIKARGLTTFVCHRTYVYQGGKLLHANK